MLPRLPPPSALGPASSLSGEEVPLCKKYIWGTCNKYAHCKYRHELDIEKMKDILQFCHDYQNRNGCTRENCKYLHATKDEENIFLATGEIPRVLADRHAAMAATASNNMQMNAETIPQIAMFINESYMSQPPPALWPPLPPPQTAQPPVATAPPPPPPASPPRLVPAHQPAQQPPPLPTPTPSVSVAQQRPAPSTYSGMPPQTPSVLFLMNQPPPMVPADFDASVPPPPIPSHLQPNTNNGQLKRKIANNGNAGTSKVRKPEGSEVTEGHCENCVQRELRIDGYKLQMEALHNEEEAQILLYKKKLQEYEIGRDILKTIVGAELFLVFDNLIEGVQSPQLDNTASSFSSGSPTVSTSNRQALLQLFQMLLSNDARNVIDPVPSTSHMDETLQSLTSISRRYNTTTTTAASYSYPGPDLIKLVVETLRNSKAPEKTPPVEERPSDMNRMNNRTNGYSGNGQKLPTSISEPARYGVPGVYSGPGGQSQDYGARVPQAMPSYSAAGPSGYSGSAPAAAPPPPAGPPGYAMGYPAIPPSSNRHYYGQSPAVPSAPNMPYNGTERATGPCASHGMQPPTTSAALRPSQPNAPNYNFMGRYHQPPYFPPYQ